MKIVVLVKHVAEPDAAWRYNDDLTVDRASLEGRLSELDEYAVEQAVSLVEKGLPATITFLTMGGEPAVGTLRKALAMGGDDAVHVVDDALQGSDALATSLVLASAVERLGFDLVVCGMASTDAEMSVIPAMVADRLGIPQVTFANALSVADGSITIRRGSDFSVDDVVAALPLDIRERRNEAGMIAVNVGNDRGARGQLAPVACEPGRESLFLRYPILDFKPDYALQRTRQLGRTRVARQPELE